ncbi:thioredoxin fold domain-containing protein [Cellulophaga sp. BC115SP]|uniref:thioredoxin family protein n=1 Tax=Cellulophaga sp. BC115SP TaxID=2683263 RepID=UPI001412EF8D|nr:thioredoxin fold domain-containing protein [Cellulophaga sp. BC115SP]NBB31603.1 thioredoxin fold domain-containing protein [Cellulophaga sp. BC115SP]
MKGINSYLLLILLLVINTKGFSQQKTQVKWLIVEQMDKLYTKSPKKILWKVYSKDCHYCHDFEEKVLKIPAIATYINQNYYPVLLDAFDASPVTFAGHTYESKDKMNPMATHLLKGTIKFPTLVFVDEQLKMLNFLQGYYEAPNIEMVLHYFGDNAYKTVSWNDFQANFAKKK